MRKTNNEYIYSPSDLIRYMESPFASWMERFDLEKPGTLERDQEDAEGKLVAEAGDEHENAYLFSLREKNFDVCEISRSKEAKELTLKAIKDQRQIIFQPYLEMNGFGGYADFLKLNEDGMYEVWDTKLARSVKPYFLVQLCCYSEMLSTITGQLPQKVGIILGNLNEEEFRTAEHFDYYLNLKKSFLEQMTQWSESNRPDPLPGAEHRDWSGAAENWMREQDHLCLVASLRSNQVKKFNDAGINTVAELATTSKTRIKGMSDETHKIKVRFDAFSAPFIRERKWNDSQKIKNNKDGSIDFSITVNSLIEVKGWILNWGEHAEVLGPKELVKDMKEELNKMLNKYQ